jgi:two-component system NtrC family sensor kinase
MSAPRPGARTRRNGARRVHDLAHLARAVTESLALEEALRAVSAAATRLVSSSSARIWVAQDDHLVLRAEEGSIGPPGDGRKTVLAFGEGLTGIVAASRAPLAVTNVLGDTRTVNMEWMQRQKFVSYIGLPLVVGERLVGVLSLHTRARHRFTRDEVDTLASFGAQAAIALRNAQLFEAAEGRRSAAESFAMENARLYQELAAREGFIRNVVDSLAEGLVVLDADGRVVTWNERLEALSGVRAADALGVRFAEVFRDLGRKLAESVERLLSGEAQEFTLEGIERRVGDDRLAVWNLKGSVLNTAGRPSGAVLLVEDISERIALARAARQAEKMAALGTLSAGVAHEVNNPIGIVTSRIELMLLDAESQQWPAALRSDLDVLYRNAQRVARITHGLLSFARQSHDQAGPVDLAWVVDETLLLVEPQMAKDGIRIEKRVTADPALIVGDASALQQVLLNLFTNAREAMDCGGGRVTVEVMTAAGQEDRVRIVVSDTGPGITAEDLPKIFDPFYTTKAHGTGLGLSVSYGIVRDHQGTIDVQSTPGEGARFIITLPALRLG